MPKQKTKSGAQKRFTCTATGKIMRKQVGVRHNLRKKTTKSKRALGSKTLVHRADHNKVTKIIAH